MAQKVNNGEAMKKILFTKMQFSRWINFFFSALHGRKKKQILVVIAASIRFIHPKNLVKEARERTEDWGDGGKEIIYIWECNQFLLRSLITHVNEQRRVYIFFCLFSHPKRSATSTDTFSTLLFSLDVVRCSIDDVVFIENCFNIFFVLFFFIWLLHWRRFSKWLFKKIVSSESKSKTKGNGRDRTSKRVRSFDCTCCYNNLHSSLSTSCSLTSASRSRSTAGFIFFLLQLLLHHQVANYP